MAVWERRPLIAKPVVLIGAARSGTKLVRDCLALQPGIARVPHDVNYVWRIGNETLDHDELDPATITPQLRIRIRGYLARFAGTSPMLVEKTVSNCLRVPFVARVLPEARFVHLIRDGRDVTESVERQWNAKPDWPALARKARTFPVLQAPGYATRYATTTWQRATGRGANSAMWGPRYAGIAKDLATDDLLTVCARQWARCVEAAMAGLATIPPSWVHTVRYEAFVAEPRIELARLGSFIGVDFGTDVTSAVERAVSTSYVGRGHGYLRTEGHEQAMAVLSPALEALGYHDRS